MKEFRFSEENAKQNMKSQMASKLPMILIAAAGGFYIAYWQRGNSMFDDPKVFLLILLFTGVAMFFGFRRGIRTGTESLMQNVYKVSDTALIRQTPSGKSININFDEVESCQQHKKGLLVKSRNKKILIPAELDSFNELSNAVQEKVQ